MSKRGPGGSGQQEGRTGRDPNNDATPSNAPAASDETAQGATGKSALLCLVPVYPSSYSGLANLLGC